MNRRGRLRACAVGAAASTMITLAGAAPAAVAAAAGTDPTPHPDLRQSSPLLTHAMHGATAIRELGVDLSVAAARNQTTSSALARLLTTDSTMWVDPAGRLFVKDPAPASAARVSAPAAAAFPYDQTFLLHSRPGAQRTIYLDFDGETVSGTAWDSLLSTNAQPAFDTDGHPATWSNAELDVVQSVYQRVAEDYAPFAVDVTTQPPAPATLDRSSAADQVYGTRVLITPSPDTASLCGGSCGGIAYIGIFDGVGNTGYEPAWVFPQMLSNNAKAIAEAAAHEAGHNLGLRHDGTSTVGYYGGQGDWAPIMGVGYSEPLVQWSQGEYADANNTEDDLAVISSYGLPVVADDFGSSIGAASPLTSSSVDGLISTRADVDVFAVDHGCDTPLSATVTPASVSPDLDASLEILAGDGSVLALNDPVSAAVNADQASGLGASASAAAPAGTYYVQVDGVGAGNPATTGYSDYASLGRYTLAVSQCPTPTAPTNVAVTKNDAARTATITWDVPATDGGSAVTGYQVTRTGRSVAGAGPQTTVTTAATRSLTFTGLGADSRYRLTVAAVNANGTGPATGATVWIRPGNLLVNGGFEADRDRNRRPDSWRAGATFTRSAGIVRQGRFAGRHHAKRNASSVASQSVPFVVGSSGYRFAGWVDIPRTRDRFGYRVRVRWLGAHGSVLRVDVVRAWHHGTRGWAKVQRRLVSPAGAVRAQVQLMATSLAGSIYVDGLLLRRR